MKKDIFTKASKKKTRVGKDILAKLEGRDIRTLANELRETVKGLRPLGADLP